jgi:hypothetical protein
MGRAPSVEKGFFPLDEELELLPSKLAPRQYEHLVHLACFMPFDKAAHMMEEIVSVHTNEETIRRLTEQVGSWIEAAQTAEVETDEELEPEDEQSPERCVISPDGAMISLVHKQWVETRTVAIGSPQEKLNAEGECEIHVGNLSYFSRLADASTFTRLASVEIRRRKVAQAREVCAVMDGADWCQMFADRHRPDAVRILDFPHAAEHITELLEALVHAKMHFPPRMLERSLHILKHRGPCSLLRMANRLKSELSQQKGVHEHLDYLHKRESLMQYPQFRRDGWPIGSGMVESAQKNVVEARLKGAGMHWQRKNVNPMLALRNAICNDRWQEMWRKAVLYKRSLQALQRSARAEQRAQASPAVDNSFSQGSPPQSAADTSQTVPPVTPPPFMSEDSRPNSSCPSTRRKCLNSRKQVNSSHQRSDVCLCGTPLVQLKGHRIRQYCSDRCRQRAHRQRQGSAETHLASSRPSAHHRQRGGTDRATVSTRTKCSPQRPNKVSGESCICGTPLVQPIGGQIRRYCSHRCRQRAYRERQARIS